METIAQIIDTASHWLDLSWVRALLWIIFGVIVSLFTKFFLSHIHFVGTSKTQNKFDDLIVQRIKTPIQWSIIFITIYFAVQQLSLENFWAEIIFSVEMTVAIFLWGVFAYRVVHFLLKYSARADNKKAFVQKRTLPLFENLLLIFAFATGSYFILVAWDINVGPLIASAGILGLALSLAAKDTMANLFAGVFIMADAPYQLGDYIVLDSGERGKITHIGIRSTRMLTRDDVEVTIPNAIMGNSKIINETAGPHQKYRVRVKVGVAYGTVISDVRSALMRVAESNQSICREPTPRVRMRSFDDSSLAFELLCWVPEPELRGKVLDELYEAVYNEFNEQQIVIPFPQRDVYLHSQ
ncbi:MAG: mechanosensitive ion channel family protein [Kangiellaceae bacterium]|jgi:small-conductance mechanosensitive channel|nr:mechanosensitive ion channel family protein [Kangiellaceae bacterium]